MAAVAHRVGIVDGRAVYLENPTFLAESTALCLGARVVFGTPAAPGAATYLDRERVTHLLVATDGPERDRPRRVPAVRHGCRRPPRRSAAPARPVVRRRPAPAVRSDRRDRIGWLDSSLMTEPEGLTLEPRPMGGILAFYAAIWSEAQAAAARWRLALIVEVAMVAAWFVIRSTAGVDGRAYMLWVLAAGVLALVAPMSGLVVFVATSVAFEPDDVARTLVPARARAAAARGRRAHPDRGGPAAVAAGAGHLARARPADRDGPRRAQHVRPVRHRHRVARRPVVAGQHGRPGHRARRGGLDRARRVHPGARRRLRGRRGQRAGLPRRIRVAGPDLRQSRWSGSASGRTSGRACRGRSLRRTRCRRSSSCRRLVLAAAVLLARDLRLKVARPGRRSSRCSSPIT